CGVCFLSTHAVAPAAVGTCGWFQLSCADPRMSLMHRRNQPSEKVSQSPDIRNLQETVPLWCTREEPAPALSEAEERLRGALEALATLKGSSSPRAPKSESQPETPVRRWERRRKVRLVSETSPGPLTPMSLSRGERLGADTTPVKMLRPQCQDLAATLRVLEDLASAADAAAETWPVCWDLCRRLRHSAVSKLAELRQRNEDGSLCSKVLAQVKSDAVLGLELLESSVTNESASHVAVTGCRTRTSPGPRDLRCRDPEELRKILGAVARDMEDTLHGLRAKRYAWPK
ncbi:unnamed protein product, partial [Durusdinium trenchii]